MRGKGIIRSQKGFTLVELGVTLAIAGIVAAIAVPSIVGVMPRIQLSNETTTLGNEIALTRVRAISKNNEFRIIYSEADDSYTLRNHTTGINFATNTLHPNVDLYKITGLFSNDTLAARPVGDVGRVNVGTGAFEPHLGQVGAFFLQTKDGTWKRCVVVEGTGRTFAGRPDSTSSNCIEE